MAKRGRPVEKYKFRNFEKTYRRYKRDYYRAARKKWNRVHGKKASARIPKGVTKNDLESVMYDKQLLSRADLRAEYKAYKRDLVAEDSTADPIQYIVSNQTYEGSRRQYQGFKKAVKSKEFQELADENKALKDLHLETVSEFEFRSGEWRSKDDFYKAIDSYYWAMKKEAEEKGYTDEKSKWRYAKQRVSELFFNRERDTDLYWGDSP